MSNPFWMASSMLMSSFLTDTGKYSENLQGHVGLLSH